MSTCCRLRDAKACHLIYQITQMCSVSISEVSNLPKRRSILMARKEPTGRVANGQQFSLFTDEIQLVGQTFAFFLNVFFPSTFCCWFHAFAAGGCEFRNSTSISSPLGRLQIGSASWPPGIEQFERFVNFWVSIVIRNSRGPTSLNSFYRSKSISTFGSGFN